MKTVELKKIRKAMEKELDAKRFEHTLGVEYTAAALAMRYGASIKNARIAGLLHDCAKCLTDEKRLSICEKEGIYVSEYERRNPSLLHAKVGAFWAREHFGVMDQDILNAIENHTTGRVQMSLLEKIIFVADYMEPGRDKASNLDAIRQLVFVDLDKALLQILKDTLVYLEGKEEVVDPQTRKTYEYYLNLEKESEDGK